MICKIIFCSEFPDIPDKAGRFTRRTVAKPFAFHPNAKTVVASQFHQFIGKIDLGIGELSNGLRMISENLKGALAQI